MSPCEKRLNALIVAFLVESGNDDLLDYLASGTRLPPPPILGRGFFTPDKSVNLFPAENELSPKFEGILAVLSQELGQNKHFWPSGVKTTKSVRTRKNCIFSNVFWDPKILTQSPFWGLSRQGAKGFLLDADVFPFDRRFTCFLLENDLKNLHDLCPSVDQCRLAADFARRQFSRYTSILALK